MRRRPENYVAIQVSGNYTKSGHFIYAKVSCLLSLPRHISWRSRHPSLPLSTLPHWRKCCWPFLAAGNESDVRQLGVPKIGRNSVPYPGARGDFHNTGWYRHPIWWFEEFLARQQISKSSSISSTINWVPHIFYTYTGTHNLVSPIIWLMILILVPKPFQFNFVIIEHIALWFLWWRCHISIWIIYLQLQFRLLFIFFTFVQNGDGIAHTPNRFRLYRKWIFSFQKINDQRRVISRMAFVFYLLKIGV